MSETEIKQQVREHYAAAATSVSAGRPSACCDTSSGSASCCGETAESFADVESYLTCGYDDEDTRGLPPEAVLASLGCGNPLAVADLRPGERVLDLGSGGGIDVLLSARRVGPTGKAYGIDMTPEMLELARANAAKAGAENVEFIEGSIEDIPLPDASIDVVISNCVINLSTDKPAVLAEMFRVLVPGGRIGISDIVAEDSVSPEVRAERGSYAGCIAGALSQAEYLDGLARVGFVEPTVEFTSLAVPGLHNAIIRARKP